MSIFTRIKNAVQAYNTVPTNNGAWRSILEPFTGAWQRNIEWRVPDPTSSPIAYACMTIIANDICKLRPEIKRRQGDIWSVDSGDIRWRILRRPNYYQDWIQFAQYWVMSKLRFGNTYALKEFDERGNVSSLYILNPDNVQVLVTDDGAIYYQVAADTLTGVFDIDRIVPASAIIHDRMNCLRHPLVGVAPLCAAAIDAGIGMQVSENMWRFYKNAAMPGGIILVPGNLDEEKAAKLKERWGDGTSNLNAGKVGLLTNGMQYMEVKPQSAVDSQLIQTLKLSDERICSVFHVPAYKVGVASAPSYNNIEAQQQDYYNTCLQIIIEQMEACLDSGLGFNGYDEGIELNLDGLMRMDSKTLIDSLNVAVGGSVMTINEARRRLNLPSITGGDTVYMQQQDYPLSEVAGNKLEADQSAEPLPAPSDDVQLAWINTQKALAAMRKAAHV